jgi:hypothetical protein
MAKLGESEFFDLLIRRSLVRAQVGEPITQALALSAAPRQTSEYSPLENIQAQSKNYLIELHVLDGDHGPKWTRDRMPEIDSACMDAIPARGVHDLYV